MRNFSWEFSAQLVNRRASRDADLVEALSLHQVGGDRAAEQIGDGELVERLAAARAAASRAGELIERLALLLECEQSNRIH